MRGFIYAKMYSMRIQAKHDSFDLTYRAPFGAVAAGTPVRLAIELPAQEASARLRLWRDGERIIDGARAGDMVEFCFTPERSGLIWYYFIIDTPEGRLYYGGAHGRGGLFDHEPPAYQLTVYDDYATPAWFNTGIAYQIFPDRFYREGRGGLPRLQYHEEMGRRTVTHEDWREPVMYTPAPGQSVYQPCDFYGGDLNGIASKLDYLQSLGVTCIYLNPIFESPSNHRYDTADYLTVDPVLGGTDALRALAAACNAQGMRIMLDGVFSHTGADSVYFDKRGVYGGGAYMSKSSKYYEWYEFYSYPAVYRCWWGFPTLPEVNELTPSYMEFVAKVFRQYAELGITSWRLDVADELPDEFIVFLREQLKLLDPSSVLLGEVWDDASNKCCCGRARSYALGHELDSAMAYPFRSAVMDFLLCRSDAYGLYAALMAIKENYPKPFYMAQLNLLGSHDTVRAQTVLSGAPDRDAISRVEQAVYRPDEAQAARGRKRLLLAAMLQFACPGVPCIYYGDEAGLTGMADPFCRGTYPWGREDKELLSAYRAITGARTGSDALMRGECAFAAVNEDVFAVLRSYEGASALALVNRAETAQAAELAADAFCGAVLSGVYRDAVNGGKYACGDTLRLVLPPLGGVLLIGE